MAELLAVRGWLVQLTPRSRDGGFDVFAEDWADGSLFSGRAIIECRRNGAGEMVGVSVVKGVCGVKERVPTQRATIVTTSYFSRGVEESRPRRELQGLELFNGGAPEAMLGEYQPRPAWRLYCEDHPALRGE